MLRSFICSLSMLKVYVSFFWLLSIVNSQQLACENRNPEGHSPTKIPGDGSFRINIIGPQATAGYYVPNEVYTITIQGLRTRYHTQKFLEFLLVAESEKQSMMGPSGLITTGLFHIIDESLSRFSDYCPDAITNSNLKPKSEISVFWTAPSVLIASCITFKATVVERPHMWFMDDGNLSQTLCPYVLTPTTTPNPALPLLESESAAMSSTIVPEGLPTSTLGPTDEKCCACDEAKYDITFEGLWSKETHPKDFPENQWLLHFSDIIGASHSKDFYFWENGKLASEGIRHVAEWGATRHLENELKEKSKFINTIIKARGLWHPNEKGQTSAAFRVDQKRHLMSLVSMIGPSPDWFVGISGLNLCTANCTWVEDMDVDLYPYDGGSDAGITYMSPNEQIEPRQPIKRLSETEPDDPRSPFHNEEGEKMKPFARVHIRRQRIYPRNCDDLQTFPEAQHEISVWENTEDASRPECAVSDWTPWSQCSVKCGKGIRMRKRTYMIPMKADMMRCDRQLEEKEMCLGSTPTCENDESVSIEEIDSICAVTRWSAWTPCSTSCGNGTRTRHRRYKNHLGRKKCNLVTEQKEDCAQNETCDSKVLDEALVPPECSVTPWSEWSPCNVTCGTGYRERTRLFILGNQKKLPSNCYRVQLIQESECSGEYGNCSFGMAEAKEICTEIPDSGQCRHLAQKFYFDSTKGMCLPFTYNGCKGNRNRFDSESECLKICGILSMSNQDEKTDSSIISSTQYTTENHNLLESSTTGPNIPESTESNTNNTDAQIEKPIDCVVSRWTEWSDCDVDCGAGHMYRSREIIKHPQNGGQKCPKHLKRRRVCRLPACVDEE